MKNKVETEEEVETLDFIADEEVSNQIDEMLDFMDVSDEVENLEEEIKKDQLNSLLQTQNEEVSVQIDASKEKLEEYVPSIKDFNIKSAKIRKIVKKAMLYTIIVMLLGFEFFIDKTGKLLNDLKVYASDNQPIKIVQNEKYGFIDYNGNKIVNPKYLYADEFISGYAIVKNSSNLPLIIDKGGKEVIPTGTYFSLYRAGEDIIASKVTKKGLKYGILDCNLKEKTKFEYDSIVYKKDAYTFVKNNDVGLLNLEGKEIFIYKLTDKDDKTIDLNVSSVTDENSERYGVVLVNHTSLIVNLKDGKTVSSPTLNTIIPEKNNVFYEEISAGEKKYMYVQGNKVLLESDDFLSLEIDSIETGVLKALTKTYEYNYISTKSLEQIKKGLKPEQVFYGDSIFIYEDYKRNNTNFIFVKNGEQYASVKKEFSIYKPFKNGLAVVKFDDGTYGYIKENGEFLTTEHFLEANEFDEYGEAIAKTSEGYGVINSKGKTIIPFKNSKIVMASSSVKLSSSKDDNIFYAVMEKTLYSLHDSKGKKVSEEFYTDVVFDSEFPLLKVSTEIEDYLLTSLEKEKIKISSFNSDYKAFENYIIVKDEYYNYKGKLIYVDKSSES